VLRDGEQQGKPNRRDRYRRPFYGDEDVNGKISVQRVIPVDLYIKFPAAKSQ